MADNQHLIYVIGLMTAATCLCRSLPFFVPVKILRLEFVEDLSIALPAMILFFLIVHELIPQSAGDYAKLARQLLALAIVAGLHFLWLNPLISIIGGTAFFILSRNIGLVWSLQ